MLSKSELTQDVLDTPKNDEQDQLKVESAAAVENYLPQLWWKAHLVQLQLNALWDGLESFEVPTELHLYKASGYSDNLVGSSSFFSSPEDAKRYVLDNGWLETDDAVVIVEVTVVAPGTISKEAIHELLKGEAEPFLLGITARNERREMARKQSA